MVHLNSAKLYRRALRNIVNSTHFQKADIMINQEIANNIFYHIELCWDYTYPTGQALETAIARGLSPFFDVQQLGSPNTITDVKADDVAIDIKGNKTLKLIKKITAATNTRDNNLVPWHVDGATVYLSVPKSVITQVRRPTVDLNNYENAASHTLKEQIDEYKTFAVVKSRADGCKCIVSFVVQYGMHQDKKFATLTVNEFEMPEIADFATQQSTETGKNNAYVARDKQGRVLYKLKSFNLGSSNMYKRFSTEEFYYRAWSEKSASVQYDRDQVQSHIDNTGIAGKFQ